ncbi:MAG TPA: hypothetical protein VGK73_11615, partial [Polyangiaceae bacterium]
MALGVGSVCLLASFVAPAQERLELVWSAPANCPQSAVVRERLRALLGESGRHTAGLRAEGRIERTEGRYRLTLTVRDATGVRHRSIESDSCADLGGAAAVALGLLLRNEPERSQGEKPSAGEAPRASNEAAPTGGAGSNARATSEGEGSSDAEGAPPAAKNESTESSREGPAEVADETSQPETFAEAGSDARARFF